ncbi:MAG: cupin domain-containing protein [Hyphomicrobium sp.]
MTVKPVINVADVTLREIGNGAGFSAKVGSFGGTIGSTGLDCMLHVVEPGKKAFPRHSHHQEHELFVILEGEGTYRFGDASYPVRAGDVCAAPTGGIETAHHIVNTGARTLKYLGIATMAEVEICEYPDSGKIAVFSRFSERDHIYAKSDKPLGYHDGES